MQVYGSLVLDDNSEVGDAVLGRCSISCVYTSAFYLPAKEAACNGSFWERILSFLLLVKWGVAGSIPGRTNCERA